MRAVRQRLILAAIITAVLAGSTTWAQRTPDQAVTYRNFDFVQAVTASMNYVYYATTGGILRYHKLDQAWDQPLTGTEGIPDEPVLNIWVDRFDQQLVIQTDFGYYEYSDFFARWYPISERPALDTDVRHLAAPDIFLTEFDAHYLGDGLFRDLEGRSFSVSDVVDDGSGLLWVGTWGMGPAKADGSSYLMSLMPYGLMQDRVDVIHADGDGLWVGGRVMTDSRTGLTRVDTSGHSFQTVESGLFTGLPSVDVYALANDSNRLYVGSDVGLFFMDRHNWITTTQLTYRQGLPDDFVLSLERVDRALYVGTVAGLCCVDLDRDSVTQVRPETLLGHVVYDLERVDGTLWIASRAGAFRYTIESDRLQQFQDRDLVISGAVLNVEHHGQDVWFATDAGVVRLDLTTGETESFDEPHFDPDHRALAVNDWIVAVSSHRGLTFIFWNEEKTRVREFDAHDGLASETILSLRFDGDYLWVGTDDGLTRFMWNNSQWLD